MAEVKALPYFQVTHTDIFTT